MKSQKKSKIKLNYKNIGIVFAIILIIIIAIILVINLNKDKELKFDEFEKIAIYNYFENDLLNVETLYQLSGKSTYNELEVFQSKLKQALDNYFLNNSSNEVDSALILSSIESKYIPDNVDFHGILVSDYEYNFENDTFVKSPGANPGLSNIESQVSGIDYSNQTSSVQKIEKLDDNKYKIYFNITDSVNTENIFNSGEVIIHIENNEFVIDSCSIN